MNNEEIDETGFSDIRIRIPFINLDSNIGKQQIDISKDLNDYYDGIRKVLVSNEKSNQIHIVNK